MNPGTSDAVAGILLEGAGRHPTAAVLNIWNAALADLPEITMLDGTNLAEAVAVDLIRHTPRFVTIAEFRGAYLARLPRMPAPNRSDLPELPEGGPVADPATAKEWIAHIRAQLAAMQVKSAAMGLGRGQAGTFHHPVAYAGPLRNSDGAGICPWPKGDPRGGDRED